ncbi:hypothetical protein CK203_040116 [Vitis vinifera]|uniref:Ubiquitin-like protease family profile domain-containing protein n=1 Tax=Vitis vinifera TaxID=29760 RepID=A0A438IE51_VITVI|nr:hypothetical protein CK203_040116 [Vitis vinifera]
MDPEEKETPKVKHRGSTLKLEIAKNRSKGIKLKIEYNSLGSHIGENSVELSSYLGTITRTHVPIIIESWRKVPKETKEKLWDLIMLQAEGGIGRVDRSVLWKKAREKKGKFNKITELVINMIDELLEKAKETGLPPPGPNDILCQALDKLDHPRCVVGQDRLVRPSSYFHQPSDDMKKIKEEIWEMVRKEMEDAATRQVMSPPTHHSDMGSNNMRQQLVLQPVVAEKPMFKMIEEPQPPEPPLKHKVIKCKLAVERKGNVVATDAGLPFPNPYEIINVGDAIGFELDWPTSLVIIKTEHPQVLDKGKKKIVKTPIIRKSKPQNHSIIKNFQKFVDGCLGFSTPQIEKRAQLLSKRLMEFQDAKYVFIPYNPDFHWVLVVIEPRKMIVHYLDPMHHKPCEDLKDIVNM